MAQSPYDLVLMDVQMPVMDGLAATGAIRSMEAQTGVRTPILAYTAHSMEEDHERCLEAGMDAVLTKPTQLHDLTAALARWSRNPSVPLPAGPAASTARRPDTKMTRPWYDRLLDRCLGDSRLTCEVLRAFLDSFDKPLSGLGEALEGRNHERVRTSAHALKGLLLTIGADEEAITCRELERAACHTDLARARELAGTVRVQWASLQSSILDFLKPAS